MSTTTLTRVLSDLGDQLATHDPAGCAAALTIAAQAAAPVAPGAAAALADPGSPDVVRARALAVASRALVRELADDAAGRLAESLAWWLRRPDPQDDESTAAAPSPLRQLRLA